MSQSLFVEKEDVFDIVIYVYEKGEDESAAELNAGNVPSDVTPKTLKFSFRYPNYKDVTSIMSQSLNSSADGELKIDFIKMQDVAMRSLLANWNLTDKNNKLIPINNQNIDKMKPFVARTLATELMSKIKIS